MTRQELIAHCLGFADAYEDYPFNEDPDDKEAWTVMRHRENKKSFAFIFERGELLVNLKCEPLTAEFLREQYPDVTPAYHMNKRHWNTVRLQGSLPEDVLLGMIEDSWLLTRPKTAGKKPREDET